MNYKLCGIRTGGNRACDEDIYLMVDLYTVDCLGAIKWLMYIALCFARCRRTMVCRKPCARRVCTSWTTATRWSARSSRPTVGYENYSWLDRTTLRTKCRSRCLRWAPSAKLFCEFQDSSTHRSDYVFAYCNALEPEFDYDDKVNILRLWLTLKTLIVLSVYRA